MVKMFPLINCLPLPICLLKHVHTRLIILTGGKNNHNIKIAQTGQLVVGIRHLDRKYTFIISENTERIDYLYGEGGGDKEGTGVKWASHYC